MSAAFLPRERHPTAAKRSFNLSFPVGGVVYTPDTRITFGQIEHISGVSVGGGWGGGAVLFSFSAALTVLVIGQKKTLVET